MKVKVIDTLIILALCMILFISVFMVGYSIAEYKFKSKSIPHCVDGYYFEDLDKCPQFKAGDWVMINIENMSYERAYNVCRHEISHEIFAEEMENNETKFWEVINNLKK